MIRLVPLLRLAIFTILASLWSVASSVEAGETRRVPLLATIQPADLPAEARQTLLLIKHGGPFPYPHKDGSIFGNFEKRLPLQRRGYYREYTVPTPGSRDRGARRIVAGEGHTGDVANSGEYYYTPDHYRNFYRIREP